MQQLNRPWVACLIGGTLTAAVLTALRGGFVDAPFVVPVFFGFGASLVLAVRWATAPRRLRAMDAGLDAALPGFARDGAAILVAASAAIWVQPVAALADAAAWLLLLLLVFAACLVVALVARRWTVAAAVVAALAAGASPWISPWAAPLDETGSPVEAYGWAEVLATTLGLGVLLVGLALVVSLPVATRRRRNAA